MYKYTHIFVVNYRSDSENLKIEPRNILDYSHNGLQCQIPETKMQIFEAWKSLLQALTHPIWYPLFCLAFTPFLAFLLIGWEVKGYFKSLRIVGILIPIYFAVFFVDLVQFSTNIFFLTNRLHIVKHLRQNIV